MSEHTPTPWIVRTQVKVGPHRGGYYLARDMGEAATAWAKDEANASFIVEAVNSHESLKAALARLRSELEQARGMVERLTDLADFIKYGYARVDVNHERFRVEAYAAALDATAAVASTERHCTFCHVPMGSSDCCESDFEAKGCPHMRPVASPDGRGTP